METANVNSGGPAEEHQGSSGTLLKSNSKVNLANDPSKQLRVIRPVLQDYQQQQASATQPSPIHGRNSSKTKPGPAQTG